MIFSQRAAMDGISSEDVSGPGWFRSALFRTIRRVLNISMSSSVPIQSLCPVRNRTLRLQRRCSLKFLSSIWLASSVVLGMSGCSSTSEPPPDLTVVSVKDLGTLETSPKILGRDGGYSGVFQGKSVWLYGDTFLASPDAEGRTLISDSWFWTSDLNAQDGISGFQERDDAVGAPTMILPESPQELAYDRAHSGNPCQEQPCGARWALWPSAIVADPAGARALIFYMLVTAAPGNFNFQAVGNSVAIWQNFQDQPQRPTINPPIVADHPDLLFNQHEPSFGSTALVNGDTLYIYGVVLLQAPTRSAGWRVSTQPTCSTGALGLSTRAMATGPLN
jgi:hypothetical protein